MAGAAARKISHRIRAVGIKSVGFRQSPGHVLRRTGGDHILARGRTVHRLGIGPGVAGGKFQDVRLIAGSRRVCIPHQFIKLRGINIVLALDIIAPTVRADLGARANGIPREVSVTGRRADLVRIGVKDSLDEEAGTRRDAQTIKSPGVRVCFAGGGVAGNNARAMRAVAIPIRAIGQGTVIFEASYPPPQIRVHCVRVARVESRIRDTYGYAGPAETQLLGDRRRPGVAVVATHDLRGEFIHEFPPRRALDPENRAGLRQRRQAGGIQGAPQNGALTQAALVLDGRKQGAHPGNFRWRDIGRSQNVYGDNLV